MTERPLVLELGFIEGYRALAAEDVMTARRLMAAVKGLVKAPTPPGSVHWGDSLIYRLHIGEYRVNRTRWATSCGYGHWAGFRDSERIQSLRGTNISRLEEGVLGRRLFGGLGSWAAEAGGGGIWFAPAGVGG